MKKLIILLLTCIVSNYVQAQEVKATETADLNPEVTESPDPNVSQITGPNKFLKFSAFLSYNLAESLSSDSVDFSGVGFRFAGSATGDIDKAFGIGAEGVLREKNSNLGFSVGLVHDLARPLKKITYNFVVETAI